MPKTTSNNSSHHAAKMASSSAASSAEVWYLGYPSVSNDESGVITIFQAEWAELYSLFTIEAARGEILQEPSDLSPLLSAEKVYINQEIVGVCPFKMSAFEDSEESHINLGWSFNDSSRPGFYRAAHAETYAETFRVTGQEFGPFRDLYQPEVSFGVNYNSIIGNIAQEIQAMMANTRQRVYDFNKYRKKPISQIQIGPLLSEVEQAPVEVHSTTAGY
jgi:hypothetical protein